MNWFVLIIIIIINITSIALKSLGSELGSETKQNH